MRLAPSRWLPAAASGGFAGALLAVSAAAPANDENWPRAWFEAPVTASERGIRQFSQSPYLDALELPPVAERLPPEPIVSVPLDEIGRYGGNARVVHTDMGALRAPEGAFSISADMRNFLPNLAERWSVSEDGRVITVKLRAGIRWSDGVPLTSDDFIFSFNDLALDPEFSPVTSRLVRGGSIEKLSELEFRYEFEQPNPLFVNVLAQLGNFYVDPKHYYQQFHPAYTDRAEIERRIEEMGYITWMAFISACRGGFVDESVEAPTLQAFRITSVTPLHLKLERNPYYYKIDPEGRQLPYIDTIDVEVINSREVIAAKAATGELDFVGTALRVQDFPLLKLAERTGRVGVRVWQRIHGSDVVIQPNYNLPEPGLRTLFRDLRFRRALSLAINREEMNEIVYFGRGTPRQVTVHPRSSYFEPSFATAHAEHDPETANALLDELGLADVDGDGLRELADGSPLTITLEFLDFETPKPITLELVANYWRRVGIDLRLKLVDASLQRARAVAGEMQMTVWHGDRVTDILFPVQPNWWVPRSVGWELSMWNDWARWYMTDGRLGEAPPPEVRKLQDWMDRMQAATDHAERVAYGKKILQSTADNLWTIGTVGLAPHPIVVSKRLRNVPARATWGWDVRDTMAYHPETWYLDEKL